MSRAAGGEKRRARVWRWVGIQLIKKSDPGDPLLVPASFCSRKTPCPPPRCLLRLGYWFGVTCIDRFLRPDHRVGRLDAQRAVFTFVSPKRARSFPSPSHSLPLAPFAPRSPPPRLFIRVLPLTARSLPSSLASQLASFHLPRPLHPLRSMATASHLGPHSRLRLLRGFATHVPSTRSTHRLRFVLRSPALLVRHGLHVPSSDSSTPHERYHHMHYLFTIPHTSQDDRLPFQEITTC